jgi:arylsulfatase A-like enzyme
VYLLDIYPTLCDLCSISIPESVDGISFAPMFADPGFVTRPELYLAFQARIRGVMDAQYKLIEYRTENLKLTQLFDLKNDPMETMNLFDLGLYDDVTARLRKRLLEFRDEWDDESILFGQQYWQQWRQYEAAELHGVAAPKGADMVRQVNDWGTNKK